jgi:hypothetical protein
MDFEEVVSMDVDRYEHGGCTQRQTYCVDLL